jgi:hypothetical protein
MNWLTLSDPFYLTSKALHMLVISLFFKPIYKEEGFLYLAGRDMKYRPSIIINSYLLDYAIFDSESFLRALYNLLAICEDYMFFPGKIENIIVFIETKE